MPQSPTPIVVWRIDLDLDAPSPDGVLSPEERTRAAGIVDAKGARRWRTARAALRAILARELGTAPADVVLDASPEGKPRLAGSSLRFSLSHSDGLALCAIGHGREVGVDVERLRPRPDPILLARRFLDDAVAGELEDLDEPARTRAFLNAWVRHEARLKCLGVGLAGAASVRTDGLAVRDLDVGPRHVAALACEAPLGQIELREWRSAGA